MSECDLKHWNKICIVLYTNPHRVELLMVLTRCSFFVLAGESDTHSEDNVQFINLTSRHKSVKQGNEIHWQKYRVPIISARRHL